jgi:membrane protein implicated in regulation of membrane protease activity
MSRPRRLQWGVPEQPPPKHPYRDTLIMYGVFSVLIVLVAWATGGGVRRALVIAILFYVVASAWSISRWRNRLREENEETRAREDHL